jgi:hypothetical protein
LGRAGFQLRFGFPPLAEDGAGDVKGRHREQVDDHHAQPDGDGRQHQPAHDAHGVEGLAHIGAVDDAGMDAALVELAAVGVGDGARDHDADQRQGGNEEDQEYDKDVDGDLDTGTAFHLGLDERIILLIIYIMSVLSHIRSKRCKN